MSDSSSSADSALPTSFDPEGFATNHRVHVGDASSMDELADDSVELVVTSPPYPMVEMWDDVFTALDPAVGEALEAGDGWTAYERMHDALGPVWDEVARVLAPGGMACVNVGDAVRTVEGDEFRCYPNHAAVTSRLVEAGLRPLPPVLWRKPANKHTKFMGSGMLPPNAYVALEHEHVLVFRKGGPRSIPDSARRRASAIFWRERNRWFSDLWDDLRGAAQDLPAAGRRDRSGAFPLALPLRLVSMYSIYGDTVLDPFWGTGTTSLAAMCTGRHSVGYELDGDLVGALDRALETVPVRSRRFYAERIAAQRRFAAEREADDDPPGYTADPHAVPVVTGQETDLRFLVADRVEGVERGPEDDQGAAGGLGTDDGSVRVEHVPLDQ